MKDTINYVNIEDNDKVVKVLAQSLESGLAEAFKADKQTVYTSCMKAEKTNLDALLKSTIQATSAIEVRFESGLKGSALLLVRMNDLCHLGEQISGTEAKIGESMAPELMESCLSFFAEVLQASNRKFAELCGAAVTNAAPELINPDGKADSLLPLASSYDGGICLTFQMIIEPKLDGSLGVLLQQEVVNRLRDLLPDYDASGSSAGSRRTGSLRQGENVQEQTVSSDEVNSVRRSKSVVRKASSNWNMDLLLDVELPIVVCFGESEMQLKDILRLGVGSVIELDRSVNDPVSIIVNQKPIARGEVVMVDGNYGVRILEVESTAERIRSLG